mgnify:FL=1
MKSVKNLNNRTFFANEKNLNVLSLIKIARVREKQEKRDTYFLLAMTILALTFTSVVITL